MGLLRSCTWGYGGRYGAEQKDYSVSDMGASGRLTDAAQISCVRTRSETIEVDCSELVGFVRVFQVLMRVIILMLHLDWIVSVRLLQITFPILFVLRNPFTKSEIARDRQVCLYALFFLNSS